MDGNLDTLPRDGLVYGIYDGKYIGFATWRKNFYTGKENISAWPGFDHDPDPKRWTWFKLPCIHSAIDHGDEY